MAPSVTSPKSTIAAAANNEKGGRRSKRGTSNSRASTPTTGKLSLVPVVKENVDLAAIFKSDLTNIRSLVTCSICDQLLYEPWTLGCGHTYCYSCLCSWFVPNKRKKTCPECREVVKQIPAPSFLVKQLVEIFIKRSELMPSDESIEQHQKKKLEETGDVDRDRNSADGLFKGAFPSGTRVPIYDEQDGVLRCPRCLMEHEGGPTCTNCFLPIENGFDYSDEDIDAEDLDDLELDLDEELNHHHHFMNMPHFGFPHFHHHHHHHHGESVASNSDSSHFNGYSDEDGEDDEDDEDDESLQDFVVPDDDHDPDSAPRRRVNTSSNPALPITISDDESDDGGPISNRRPRRPGQVARIADPREHSVVELSSSEAGDLNEEALMLRDAGWSPLSQENDSDAEETAHRYDYGPDDRTSDEQDTEDGSDTETIGNRGSEDEDEDDQPHSGVSRRYQYHQYEQTPSYESADEDAHWGAPHTYGGEDGEDSEIDMASRMDHDGDTEMSASPRASRTSLSPDVTAYAGYGYGMGVTERRHPTLGENLGATNQVIDDGEDNSSDSSPVRPPPRRRPRRTHQNARVQQYDPRISMIFAEHQQSIRGAQDQETVFSELDAGAYRIEPASRTRRMAGYRYRHQPSRRADPLRGTSSPSATRVISSSSRAARLPRQYQTRN